ncbi:MAG: universal stress protein [Halobacteriaceae archaeon]
MRVLLGIGGSEDSVRALERTLHRAREAGDELTIAVLENPESERPPPAVIDLVRDRLAAMDLTAEVRRLTGEPGPALVELAERGSYDEVVLGGGDRSPMGKLTVGSIAEFVLLNGEITVTLVR